MEEESTLHLELHKLSCVNSDETMDTILRSIWNTRKTGLRGADKSKLRSLLHLSSPSQLDPVLACLRSLVRKCAYQNFASNELVKLFPPDLPLDLQSILLLSLQKNQEQWREDIAREQDFSPRTSVSYQVRANVPPSFTSLPSSEMQMSPSLWPRQDDSIAQLNHNDFGISAALVPNVDLSGLPACFQCDTAPAENLVLERHWFRLTVLILNFQCRSLSTITFRLGINSKFPNYSYFECIQALGKIGKKNENGLWLPCLMLSYNN
ncbi:uncharacterized protein DS421_6g190680 [Arachis hypogaea]|nr:uncharacterized protein DS421_6g190680 [Arachis hypogaea]